jgi:hypothetical protein
MHELSSDLVAACRIGIDSTLDSARHAGDLHTPLNDAVIRTEDLVHVGAYLPRKTYEKKMQDAALSVGIDLPTPTAPIADHVAPGAWRRNPE